MLRSGSFFFVRRLRKPFNPLLLISHLTNSNRCGNLQPRLVDCVPVSTSLPPPANLCSQVSRLALFPKRNARRIMLLPALCSLFAAPKKVNSFAINQIQPLFAKHPGWGMPSVQPSTPISKRRRRPDTASTTAQRSLLASRCQSYARQVHSHPESARSRRMCVFTKCVFYKE